MNAEGLDLTSVCVFHCHQSPSWKSRKTNNLNSVPWDQKVTFFAVIGGFQST